MQRKSKSHTVSKGRERARRTSDRSATDEDLLVGWKAIADFLGQPSAVAQRWARDGMPVTRKGRSMTASRRELQTWLGEESGAKESVLIPTGGESDLLGDLRRGLKQARSKR